VSYHRRVGVNSGTAKADATAVVVEEGIAGDGGCPFIGPSP